MTDRDRVIAQAECLCALSPDERLFALLTLRYDAPDVLDAAIAKAHVWRALRAAGSQP